MEYTKKITIETKVWKCDFCDTECVLESVDPQPCISSCCICRKDICNDHVGEGIEDGCLCVECAKTHELWTEDGCVGVKNLKTGKFVENYL